jgi:alkylmercury lyase
MAIATRPAQEPAVEIRPGVFRPDWSIVTTPAAREALKGRMAARANLLQKWCHVLDESEDNVWRSLLQLFADHGRPPSVDELVRETEIPVYPLATLLRNLERRDLIGLESGSERVLRAYPFTEASTGHRVELNGHHLNALCAIDALGVGSMYHSDVRIESPCRFCSEAIRIATADQGQALHSIVPADPVVWYDFAFDGSAATSCCPVIAFFCSDGHLRRWLDGQNPKREGIRLTLEEGLEVGRAIFGPVLAVPEPNLQSIAADPVR